jgi:hypothetical protein
MLDILQTTIWYLGVGLLLSCVIILIDEQIITRIKEIKDEKVIDNN